MATVKSLDQFLNTVREVFLARHLEYGTSGMDVQKAISLAETKLDRLRYGGAVLDSAVDLAGYGAILWLLSCGLWSEPLESLPTKELFRAVPEHPRATEREEGVKLGVKLMVKNTQDDGAGGIHAPRMAGDVGFDLECSEDFDLPPHGTAATASVVPAGVNIKSPDGYFCQIVGRSSAAKRGIGVQTAVIDCGYTGPMFSCVWNMTSETIHIKKGDRIAQVIFLPSCIPEMELVCELPNTERGSKGFGSTRGTVA